ncbi:hypothetical protein BDN71DRAFT_1431468 [Pleurotus eryngii]|uniref:Uncharacterized protein n=1 Tax=Pleurotus eryngii TaxID=5323 RepID=A0A9P6D6P2_PLEER|nr:hypothetical protein BDN71DRAFT_1431468 [Pleurotus eryngii]
MHESVIQTRCGLEEEKSSDEGHEIMLDEVNGDELPLLVAQPARSPAPRTYDCLNNERRRSTRTILAAQCIYVHMIPAIQHYILYVCSIHAQRQLEPRSGIIVMADMGRQGAGYMLRYIQLGYTGGGRSRRGSGSKQHGGDSYGRGRQEGAVRPSSLFRRGNKPGSVAGWKKWQAYVGDGEGKSGK